MGFRGLESSWVEEEEGLVVTRAAGRAWGGGWLGGMGRAFLGLWVIVSALIVALPARKACLPYGDIGSSELRSTGVGKRIGEYDFYVRCKWPSFIMGAVVAKLRRLRLG